MLLPPSQLKVSVAPRRGLVLFGIRVKRLYEEQHESESTPPTTYETEDIVKLLVHRSKGGGDGGKDIIFLLGFRHMVCGVLEGGTSHILEPHVRGGDDVVD